MYTIPYHHEDLSGKCFLVTGGAGFIGSNLVEYLLTFGARKVRVLDDFSTGLRHNLKDFYANPAFELMEGDIRRLDDCRAAVEGMDYVAHQAALGSVPRSIDDPLRSNEVNVSGFLNMLVAARDARVHRFVYAASSSTYGDHPAMPKVESQIGNPLSPYAVTKYVNELYASVFSRTYGFHSLGLRYFNVFGPRQNPDGPYAAVIPLFIASALRGEAPVINGDGETSRDFTFIENAVQANIKALLLPELRGPEVINIAFGARTTLNQLWQNISNCTGVQLSPSYQQERRGDVKHSLASITKAEQLINYHPEVSVLQGIQRAVDWYTLNQKNQEPVN